MKLSAKGLKKIKRWQDAKRLGHAYPVDEIEFEHDDFEGFITLTVNIPRGVFLTVEEAKEIHDMLADNENYMPEGLWDMGHWLKNKIEQSEKSNE